MFSKIFAIINVIQLIDGWVKRLAVMYVTSQINKLHESDKEAIRKAIYEHDQRDLEKQIGSTRPGEPSGIGGVEHRVELPNVVQDPVKK